MPRPNLRPVFVDPPRRPRVTFRTSSTTRFLQARMVFGRFGLDLGHHAGDAGGEEHDGGYVFVESTSVRLEALGDASTDVPGVASREWFDATTAEELRAAVLSSGGTRAVVRSDIALWVPGVGRAVPFRGETAGTIAAEPPRFPEDPHYPWLSPCDVVAWLVPDDSTRCLGEMSFEHSWDHDPRVKALSRLIERLEEYAVALNPPPALFRRRLRCAPGEPGTRSAGRPPLAIVGPTCSGKTTFGDHPEAHEAQVIDASSVVRMLAERRTGAPVDMTEFADELLAEEGADVVARHIVDMLDGRDRQPGAVITGLRVIEEIEYLRSALPDLVIVSLESPRRRRYDRFLRRDTRARLRTYEDFRERDELQRRLGLLEVVEDIADVRIRNDGSVEDFSAQVSSTLAWSRTRADPPGAAGVRVVDVERDVAASRLLRCLDALADGDIPPTAEHLAATTGLRRDEVEETLRGRSATVERVEDGAGTPRYRLRGSGEALLRALGRPVGADRRALEERA